MDPLDRLFLNHSVTQSLSHGSYAAAVAFLEPVREPTVGYG